MFAGDHYGSSQVLPPMPSTMIRQQRVTFLALNDRVNFETQDKQTIPKGMPIANADGGSLTWIFAVCTPFTNLILCF